MVNANTPDRTNPKPCMFCGAGTDKETTNIGIVTHANKQVEKEVSVRCIMCHNLKYGSIKPIEEIAELEEK